MLLIIVWHLQHYLYVIVCDQKLVTAIPLVTSSLANVTHFTYTKL